MKRTRKRYLAGIMTVLMLCVSVIVPTMNVSAQEPQETETSSAVLSLPETAGEPQETAESSQPEEAVSEVPETPEQPETAETPEESGETATEPSQAAKSASAAKTAPQPLGENDPGKDMSAYLKKIEVTVKQDGNEVQPGDVLLDNKPINLAISFDVPVLGDGYNEEDETYIRKGDYALIPLSSSFKLSSGQPIALKFDDGTPEGILVGYVSFVTDSATKMVSAKIIFDGADVVFEEMEHVSAKFKADFAFTEEGNEAGTGGKDIKILEIDYKLEKEPVETKWTLTKFGEVNLSDQTVEWTVKVSGKKGTSDVDIAGYELRDDLTNVGTYVPGSFIVNTVPAADPEVTDNKLSYTFPENSTGEQTVKFKTEIPDDQYFANGQQRINNKAELYNEDEYIVEDSSYVEFTPPTWIEKKGKADTDQGSDGAYNPKDRTITWTITANQTEATLKNPVLNDMLPEGLTLDKAEVQYWNGADWGSAQNITPDADGNYEIGNTTDADGNRVLNTKVLLTIVTKVPDEDHTTNAVTYHNTASITWDGYPGEGDGIHSNEVGVGIGYNAITKKGEISDKDNQTIRWTVDVNAKGQTIPNMKVYDLLIHGKPGSVDLSDLTIAGVDDEVKKDLVPQYNQRYKENSFAGTGLIPEVIPVMKDGARVGDLLVVTGFGTEKASFTFESIVTDPDIFAGNKSTDVKNTAVLFSANQKLNEAPANVSYPSNMLKKELIKRGHTDDPAAGVNDISSNGGDGFDYEDKSAIFRISVNADGLDLTNATGKALGKVTVTDTLPEGWELAEILPGQDYLVFEGNKNTTGQQVTATDTTPDAVAGLTYTKTANSITFTFEKLNQPYVILIKAKPNADTLKEYFGKNGTYTPTNTVKMTADNWTTGIEAKQNVSVKSSLLSKKATLVEAGVVNWTVDYKPYELENTHSKLEDTLPAGLELRTDASGKLVLDGNISIIELTMNADGSYTEGGPVPPVIGTNVFYDRETRTLSFTIPEPQKAYRFTYLTDVTGDPGTVKNKVTLYGADGEPEHTGSSYIITDQDGSATMRKSGYIEIAKLNGATKESLQGVEFTIYASDGETIIRRGITAANGKLTLRGLPEGSYLLRETGAPEGYTPDSRTHSLTVTRKDSTTITCSIDGKDTNAIVVQNFKTGTAGGLKLTKTLAGASAETDRGFDFTVTLEGTGATEFTYFGTGGAAGGTLKSGDTVSLKGGESIEIVGIPKGTAYTVTEADYQSQGYTAVVEDAAAVVEDAAQGMITADEMQSVAFVNTRAVGSLEIRKTVTGNASDPEKKFDFTVTFTGAAANGTYSYTGTGVENGTVQSGDTISLADGESIRLEGLPAGTEYTVTESDYSGEGYVTTAEGESGMITEETVSTAAFTNDKAVGSLEIRKTVTGNGGDTAKKFDFTVTFSAAGTYSYIGTGVENGTITSGGAISLANGESIRIEGLPAGTEYTVAESDYTADGYVTAAEGESGTITEGTIQSAAFTNDKRVGLLEVSKRVAGNAADPTEKFDFTVTFEGVAAGGEFRYAGTGVEDGTIQSGDTIQLAHGQSIRIEGLPVGTEYTVTEKDYSGEGYLQTATDETGAIAEGIVHNAAFVNARAVGAVQISKKAVGNGADPDKKFDFTVTFSADGTYSYTGIGVEDGSIQSGDTVSLAHGESILIEGLPVGTEYSVTEKDYTADGYIASAQGAAGTVTEGTVQNAAFVNTRAIGSLEISKTVEGNSGDKNRAFTFTVTFSAAGSYPYSGSRTGEIKSGDGLTLKHGESVFIANLPAGTTYQVTEKEANQDGYVTKVTGDTGTITEAGALKAAFTNTKNVTPETPKNENNDQAKTTGSGSQTPQTGDSSRIWPMLIALVLSAAALLTLAFVRRNGRKYRRKHS